MLKAILLVLALFLAQNVMADLVQKGSATDKAIGAALVKATDYTATAVSITTGALGEVVKESIVLLKSGKDFVVDQAPKVIKEFMYWRMGQCIFYIVLSLFLAGLALFAAYRIKVYSEKPRADSEAYLFAGLLRWIVTPVIILIGVFPNIYELVYIMVAPRIYLIENLAHLIKWGSIQP